MRFVLTINLGNEAMQTASDIARALRDTASKLVQGGYGNLASDGDSGPIRDDNGNRVGSWHVEGETK